MDPLYPGSVIPAGESAHASKTGITDAGYSISDSTSLCHGHSSDPITNPARTGFSFT
jgi:hypothetical protein